MFKLGGRSYSIWHTGPQALRYVCHRFEDVLNMVQRYRISLSNGRVESVNHPFPGGPFPHIRVNPGFNVLSVQKFHWKYLVLKPDMFQIPGSWYILNVTLGIPLEFWNVRDQP